MDKRSVSIFYKCNNYLLVNKPSGYICQPGKVKHPLTNEMVNGQVVLDTLKKECSNYSEVENWKSVHRIDRGVTGGLLIATNNNAAIQFSKNLRNGGNQGYKMVRKYVALLDPLRMGIINIPEKGKIVTGRMTSKYKQFDENCFLFELVTGGKHQIRHHSVYSLKAPILNDTKYGGSKRGVDEIQIALHSAFIRTQIGFNVREHFIPMIHNNDGQLWDRKFLDKDGYFISGINQLLKENWDSQNFEDIEQYNFGNQ